VEWTSLAWKYELAEAQRDSDPFDLFLGLRVFMRVFRLECLTYLRGWSGGQVLVGDLNDGDMTLDKGLGKYARRTIHARRTFPKGRAQFLSLGQPLVEESRRSPHQAKSAIRADPDRLFELNVVHG